MNAMTTLTIYSQIGLAVFLLLLAYRSGGVLLGKFDHIVPVVEMDESTKRVLGIYEWGTVPVVLLLLGACIVGWPAVAYLFFKAGVR